MIEITVSNSINAKIEAVFELLIDYSGYKNWWLIPVETLEGKERYFQFSPIPFVKIGLQESLAQPYGKLTFNYIKGPFRGEGIWVLKQLANDLLDIRYTVKLQPVNKLIELAANTKFFEWKHSQDIQNIIQTIEKEVGETDH